MRLLSDLYNVTLKRGIRGKAKEGFVRPTIGQSFMTHKDFKEVISFEDGPGPGPDMLQYDGATKTGYYGHVTSEQFISGDYLASEVGVITGTDLNRSDVGWEKFFVGAEAGCNRDGVDKVLFVAKKPLRHTVSRDALNSYNIIYGNTTIVIDGLTYKVRLLTGTHSDPGPTYQSSCVDDVGANSEWNDLIYRIHTDVPNCTDVAEGMSEVYKTVRHGGPQVGNNWNNYTNDDLGTPGGKGSYNWCQETDMIDHSRYIHRGYAGIAGYITNTSAETDDRWGWRPCLELIS